MTCEKILDFGPLLRGVKDGVQIDGLVVFSLKVGFDSPNVIVLWLHTICSLVCLLFENQVSKPWFTFMIHRGLPDSRSSSVHQFANLLVRWFTNLPFTNPSFPGLPTGFVRFTKVHQVYWKNLANPMNLASKANFLFDTMSHQTWMTKPRAKLHIVNSPIHLSLHLV